MLYIYSTKTLRDMLADANAALALSPDSDRPMVEEMISAIKYELTTRKATSTAYSRPIKP